MPRNSELPEGTDHIINGAMETNGGGGGAGSGSADTSPGFIGTGMDDDTGGTSVRGRNMAGSGPGEGSNGGSEGVLEQLKSQAFSLRDQAGDRARDFAETGKARATDALDEISRVVSEAADSIEDRVGTEYGEYARRAADAVSGFADTLRNKEVDDLYEDARSAVRKSPGVALAAAAVVGFALVRLIKAGLPAEQDGDTNEDIRA